MVKKEKYVSFFFLYSIIFCYLADASEIFISSFDISIFFCEMNVLSIFYLRHCNNYFFLFTLLSQQSLHSNLFSLQFVVYFFVSSIILFFFIACFASSIVILIFMFSSLCVHSLSSISLFLPLFFIIV